MIAEIRKKDSDFAAFIEEDFTLKAFDGKAIYGTLSRAVGAASQKAVILSHGLTGHPNEYIHLSARNYFNEHGYDVIRFSYYCAGANARNLRECTLKIHASDLNDVVAQFRPKYKKLFLAGHSYGGLTVLFANPDVEAVSFWDASFVPDFWKTESSYVPELDCYKIGWGCENLAGKTMYQEAETLTEDKATLMAKSLNAPGQVLLAGNNSENKKRTILFDVLNEPKAFYDVPDADHCFTKGRSVDTLLEKTHSWFERF